VSEHEHQDVPSFEASNRKLEDLGLGNSAEANSNRFHCLLISFNLSPEQNLRVKVYQRSEDIKKMLGRQDGRMCSQLPGFLRTRQNGSPDTYSYFFKARRFGGRFARWTKLLSKERRVIDAGIIRPYFSRA